MKIDTVHARPDSRYVVNLGSATELAVSLGDASDASAASTLEWLRSNQATSWTIPISDIRKQAERVMLDWINQLTAQVTSGYSSAEIASWP